MAKQKKPIKVVNVVIGCVFRTTPPIPPDNTSRIPLLHEVLLVKRSEKRLSEIDEMWELPGGKIEANELPETAIEREIYEETGYLVRAISPLNRFFTFVRDYPEFLQQTRVTCYQCELRSNEKHNTKPDSKIAEVQWFDPAQIDYLKTLVGSREFIVDIARQLGIQIQPTWRKVTSLAQFLVPLEITPKGSKDRRGREYVVIIQFHPESNSQYPYVLMTHRGGLKRKFGREMVEPFENSEQVIAKAKKRIADRFHHDYVLVDWDDDFPKSLIEWIRGRGYPIRQDLRAEIKRFHQPDLFVFPVEKSSKDQ